ncbi:DUF417 family protein [Pantoea sp.]|uniref:DUF417 family protein n=1 Tax=Pantoea sp. TaxID=69393 RepID=UPI0031D051A7
MTAKYSYLSCAINFLNKKDIIALRLSLIVIFLFFGIAKWFEFEVQALTPIITATWLNIFNQVLGLHGTSYFLGGVELTTVVLLLLGFKNPMAGAAGAAMIILTGLVTLSLLPQLGTIDSFILKDIMVVAIGLTLLKQDLIRWHQE